MNGKDKCRILKQIRAEIAANNDIAWITEECGHKGNCSGTCPRCEAEVRKLEKELAVRQNLGKVVTITGLGLAAMAALVGCKDDSKIPEPDDLTGAMVPPEEYLTGEVAEPDPDDDEYIVVLDGDVAYCPDDETTEPSEGDPDGEQDNSSEVSLHTDDA